MTGHIEVVRGRSLLPGAMSPGIIRDKAFDTSSALFSRSRISGGNVSAWHHHGTRELFGFLLSGRLKLEYGEDGEESVELEPGDFFRVPAGLVHRDLNPAEEEAVVVNILIGQGPAVVNTSDKP